jgi:glucose-1-phosphate adenylyltransferase
MDMLSPDHIDLYDQSWPIRARSPKAVPEYIGDNARVSHSIITEGCRVFGSVKNSVLASKVQVEDGALVDYSILMPGAVVERGAVVEYAIIGENSRVCAGARVGAMPGGEDWGIATCGPGTRIAPGAVVPAGAMIYSDVEAEK